MDLLRTEGDSPALPLRYGRVVAGSERVVFAGRTLQRERDYTIDHEAGVVYLRVPSRPGQTVTVEYRYDEATGREGTFGVGASGAGFLPLSLRLAPGSSVVLGLGITERLADGTVLRSDVYGLRNDFDFGVGRAQGLFMVGRRKRAHSVDMLSGPGKGGVDVEEGKSHAIVQRLGARAFGGVLQVHYQDIGSGFGPMQSFQGAGFEESRVAAMARERGLKRVELRAEGLGGPELGLGAGYKTVGADEGAVTWRDYSARIAGTDVRWSSHAVDPGFSRFEQIAEDDREQLGRERGLERTSLSAARAFPGGRASYEALNVRDREGKGIHRRAVGLETPWLKGSYRDQHVVQGFTRFRDLREADRDQLGREGGLVRQAAEVSVAPIPWLGASYRNDRVRTQSGDLNAVDFGLRAGRLSVEHASRDVGEGFGGLGALTASEVGGHIASSLGIHDPGLKPRGEDHHGWGSQRGMRRVGWRVGYDLGKGSRLGAQAVEVEQSGGALESSEVAFESPKLGVRYRAQSADAAFDPERLFFGERQRYGTARGLSKVDLDVHADLGRGRKAAFEQTAMGDGSGGASRRRASYQDRNLTVSLAERTVAAEFAGLPRTVDPERDLFLGLLGDRQSEAYFAWRLSRAFGVEHREVRAIDAAADESKSMAMSKVATELPNGLQFEAMRSSRTERVAGHTAIDRSVEAARLSQDLGWAGKVTVSAEEREFRGVEEREPDSERQSIAYEARLTEATSVRTEHGVTRYANGERETLTSNSLAHRITPRAGVSVTDTQIRRDGERPDERARDYGFWVDFGSGIRLDYKTLRTTKGADEGHLRKELTVTPGQFGGIEVRSLDYRREGWDDRRDHHTGNVSIGSVRPLSLGFLKDVRFGFAADTVRDRNAWQRENRSFGAGARVGGFAFGFDYRSQTSPAGGRAIDRQFSVATDVSGKSKLRGEIRYNLRTLPRGEHVMVRDYRVTGELGNGWSLHHRLSTNPLQADGDALLGDRAAPTRSTKWSVDCEGSKGVKTSFLYEEFVDEQSWRSVASTRLTLTLFADNPSPLVLEYGMSEGNGTGRTERSHTFSLRYDQRPGPNQTLSLRFGNKNWEVARPLGEKHQDWNLRLDYALRF